MAVEIITEMSKGSVFVCTTSDTAFGPIMEEGTAEDFLEWLNEDPRVYSTDELCDKYSVFLTELEEFMICAECGKKHVGGTESHDRAVGA